MCHSCMTKSLCAIKFVEKKFIMRFWRESIEGNAKLGGMTFWPFC